MHRAQFSIWFGWLVGWYVVFAAIDAHTHRERETDTRSPCSAHVKMRCTLVHLFVSWLVSQLVKFAFFHHYKLLPVQWLLGFCARRIKPKSSVRRIRAHLPRITHSLMKLRDNNQYYVQLTRAHSGHGGEEKTGKDIYICVCVWVCELEGEQSVNEKAVEGVQMDVSIGKIIELIGHHFNIYHQCHFHRHYHSIGD